MFRPTLGAGVLTDYPICRGGRYDSATVLSPPVRGGISLAVLPVGVKSSRPHDESFF